MVTVDPRESLALRDARPVVPLPPRGLSTRVLLIVAVALAAALFFMLDARRRSLVQQNTHPRQEVRQPIAAPPELEVPPAPFSPLQPATAPERDVPALPTPSRPLAPSFAPNPIHQAPPQSVPSPSVVPQTPAQISRRSDAPILAVDTTSGLGGTTSAAAGKELAGGGGNDDAVRATLIRNRSSLIPQGTLIQATLETPLNSSRPGLARAIVSRDAVSFDGSRILIPRGSRLIGEFQSDSAPDARRVLVTWTRLIRPDGVAIRIASPSGDALGGAGIPGKVNTHFFERFSNAVLQSALTVGVNLASRPSGTNSLYVGIPGQANSLGQQLLPNIAPRTTIKVRQGAEISIFVARDLDFGGTLPV